MNILFVHSIGRDKFGGGEKWLINVAEGLKNKGHKIWVGVRPESRLLNAAVRKGLETVNLNILSDISIYHIFKITWLIRKLSIDVVITKGRDLTITGLAAKASGNPLLIVRHGLPLRKSFRKHRFLLNKFADGIIANTNTIKELYESMNWVPADFTRVIYNGTSVNSSTIPFNYGDLFPGKRIILSVGRLARQKGFEYLIEAAGILNNSHDDLMLIILGQGKLEGKLRAYAKAKGVSEMIHFAGFIEDVSPYLKGCDIFVLPSLYEGMPNAAMEAMAYGKPVIITRVNGASELIPDEGKGILIPPRDPQAIADELEKLLHDNERSQRMGLEAERHIKENYSIPSMVSNIESYLEKQLSLKRKERTNLPNR